MPRYELDEYVQEHPADDAVNANCVASWTCADAENRPASLVVDLHNGWYFDSRCWSGHADAPRLILRALQMYERGRRGNNRMA